LVIFTNLKYATFLSASANIRRFKIPCKMFVKKSKKKFIL
jgi:hypothetical protein